jgi:hypothetical protein
VAEKGSLLGHSLHITRKGCHLLSLGLAFSLWTRCAATAEQTGLRVE